MSEEEHHHKHKDHEIKKDIEGAIVGGIGKPVPPLIIHHYHSDNN